ncbi:transglycosylase domain-containing protein [Aquincola sp. S2]|uniref:Transglycosylase domain-containing protein n=1 Tax=Pseudaquabacterium terrae TaxID=2732868 RepID=A0ABX2ET94_9BURK|nr:transglycosylase domain-containing protein [Aquabacterium terrae]
MARTRLSRVWAVLRDPGSGWAKRSRYAAGGLAALFIAAAALFLLYALVLIPFTPSTRDLRSAKTEYSAVLRSADGQELAAFRRRNREWVKLTGMSPAIVDALVAAEDHRFFDHPGLDFKRTAAAVFHTLTGDVQGGSTITQQLARNLYPDDIGRSLSLTRKLKEAITALKIESIYTKQEILETYLNTVPFLYNAYGIEMAARTYFDKSAHELDTLESATLIGMLKGTSYYNPVLNPERAVQRRNIVLAQMVKHQRLTPARFEVLHKRPLRLDFERQREPEGVAPHFAEHLRKWLIGWADRNGYNLYADGLVIYTTLDSRLQSLGNQAVARQAQALQSVADVEWGKRSPQVLSTDLAAYGHLRRQVEPFAHFWSSRGELLDTFIRETGAYRAAIAEGLSDADAMLRLKADAAFLKTLRSDKTRLQAGFVAIDPRNGHVKAWVGSRDFQQDPFDHVHQARRQPGSTFKPFVYAAAFEQGAKPNDTLIDKAVEIALEGGEVWRPNEGDATTGQAMSLRNALAQSKNTITAQLVQRVGAGNAAKVAHAMGVRQSKLDPVPSLALGTSPVTLKEMVSGYGTIVNDGHYIEPILITRIEDRHRRVLAEFEPQMQPAISRASAHALIDAMRAVIDAGTGTAIRERFGIQADVAGKTGTTQNNTDGWFILMHPQLVGGAWVGFNDNRVAMRSAHWGQGGHSALHIVGDFFQQALATQAVDPRAGFAAPRERPALEPVPVLRDMGGWLARVFGPQRPPDRRRGGSVPPGEILPEEEVHERRR